MDQQVGPAQPAAPGLPHGPDAWETTYRRLHPTMVGYARRRLRSPVAAEDAVSETMSRALRSVSTYEPQGPGVDGWMWGILRNVVREMTREAHRLPLAQHEPADHPSLDAGPLERVVDAEELAHLRAAFSRLADTDRELLELRLVAGLSTTDVATVLDRREGAVRMAQSRAISRLRRHLEEVSAGG